MTSEEIQTIEFNGKTIPVSPEVAQQIADSVGKGGMYSGLVEAMQNSSSTTIARSSGEDSKHNYQVKLRIVNLVVGNRRMGGLIWLQTKSRGIDDDEELSELSEQFPNAEVTRTSR